MAGHRASNGLPYYIRLSLISVEKEVGHEWGGWYVAPTRLVAWIGYQGAPVIAKWFTQMPNNGGLVKRTQDLEAVIMYTMIEFVKPPFESRDYVEHTHHVSSTMVALSTLSCRGTVARFLPCRFILPMSVMVAIEYLSLWFHVM